MGRVFGVVACVFFLLAGVLGSPAAAQDAEPPPAATTTTVGEPDPAPATSAADPAPAEDDSTTTTEGESGGSVTSAIGTTIVEADESTTTTASTLESDAEVEGGDAASEAAEAELEAEEDKPVEEDPFGGELVGAEPPAFDPDWEPEVSVGVDVVSGELVPVDVDVSERDDRELVPAAPQPDGVKVPESGEILVVDDFDFELPVFAEREVRVPLEPGRRGVAEGLPITVLPRAADVAAVLDGRAGVSPEVRVVPAGRELAASLSEVGLLFQMRLSGFGNDLGRSDLVGAEGVSPTLGALSGWSVEIDPAVFEAAPAGLRDRLGLRVFAGCDETGCEISESLETTRSDGGMIVAEIPAEVLAAVGGPRKDGLRHSVGGIFEQRSSSFAAMVSAEDAYFGVASGTSGDQGNFSASTLESLASWQVGLSTGYAEASYQIPVPPAVGPAPTIAFSYSSGLVDGMNTSANNQASQLGLGWSHATPVISRATRSCADQGAEAAYLSNLCLPVGRDDGFSLSMNGVGGRLVRTTTTPVTHPQWSNATYHEYVLESANGWRIRKVENDALADTSADGHIPDRWGTWWEITTEDGTLHVFGRNWVVDDTSGSTGNPLQRSRQVFTDVELRSVQFVPMYVPDSSNTAALGCDGDLCNVATAWYLDQTIDTYGNTLVNQYWHELNYFDAKRPGGTSRLVYVRYVNLAETYYGRTFGSAFGVGDKFRVHFEYTTRADVPLDLTCGATGSCDKNSPSFFSSHRLLWVQTYAVGQSPSEAGRWNFTASVPAASTDPLDDDKLQLDQIQRVDPASPTSGLNPVVFTYELKGNRVNHPTGVPEMQMQRLKTLTNEFGGTVTFTYDQPFAPVPGGSASDDCSAGATPTNGYVRLPCNMFVGWDGTTNDPDGPGPLDPIGGFVLWNSYVVSKQHTDPNFGQSHTHEELTFTYLTPPSWRYSGTWGLEEHDDGQCELGLGCNLWNDYRGHEQVLVVDRAGNRTHHYFHTGMRDDRTSGSDERPLSVSNPSSPFMTVEAPDGSLIDDERFFAGRSLGSVQLTSASVPRYRTTTTYAVGSPLGNDWPYSRRDTQMTEEPVWFGPNLGTGGSGSKVVTFYDARSQPVRQINYGHYTGLNSSAADDVTTFWSYSANTTAWIVGLPYRIASQAGALPSINGSLPYLEYTLNVYDNNPASGTPPQLGRVTSTANQLDTGSVRTTRYTYQPTTGQMLTETLELGAPDATTTYEYDNYGSLISVDGPLSNDETTFKVDPRFGARTEIIAPNTQRTGIALDTYGRTWKVSYPGDSGSTQWFQYLNAGSDPARVRTYSLNQVGEYVYSWEFFDGFGRPIQTQTIAENGSAINVLSTGYDLAGREHWVTQPYQEASFTEDYQPYSLANTDRTVFTYNTSGLTRTRVYNGSTVEIDTTTQTQGWQTTSTDPLGNVTVSMVDVDGNLVSVQNADNQTTTYAYNVRGDLTTITDPQGNQITNTYANWSTQVTQMTDPDLGTITYDYDIAGRLESQTDARGNALFVTYNVASQPTSMNLNSPGGPVVSSWVYDGSGRMTSTTHNNLVTAGSTPQAVTTSYLYDARNRVERKTWTIPGLPGGSQDIDYTYRQLGAIDTITYPNGTVVDYAFNKETEQPVSVTVDGTTVASGVRYNPAGQVSFIQRGQPNWDGSNLGQLGTTFEYDYAQRIESISTVGLDEPDATDDALVRLYRATFDRDPDAPGWGYWLPQYAEGLPLANIAQVFHDSSEFPATWTDFDATVQDLSDNFDFVMWMYGHIIDRQPGNRSGWSWWQTQLDNGNWTRGQAIAHFTGLAEALNNSGIGGTDATTPYAAPNPVNADVPQELAYTWDDAGNLTRVHETSEGVDQWQCFTYDNQHRLDLGYIHGSSACGAYQAIGPDPFNVDYAYDSIGNITSAAGTGTVSGSYTYSSTKPHAVTQAGTNNYGYDASGNMTTRTTSIGTQTLVYDVLNRLVEITGAGDPMTALYDADGVRVKRDLDGDTVFYLTDGYEIHDPATGPDTETIHFTLAGVTVGSEVDGTLFVSASDHLGSGSISRDDTGATTTQRYTPYGAIRGGGGNGLPSDFTFTGQTDDPGTGLIDYNARHYDPQLGRFVMADPVLDGLNRYAYVGNNPTKYVDPTGHIYDTPDDSYSQATYDNARKQRELSDLFESGSLDGFNDLSVDTRSDINVALGGDSSCAAEMVDGGLAITVERSGSCGFFYAGDHPDSFSQTVANQAGAVYDKLALGVGRELLEAGSWTAGRVDWDDPVTKTTGVVTHIALLPLYAAVPEAAVATAGLEAFSTCRNSSGPECGTAIALAGVSVVLYGSSGPFQNATGLTTFQSNLVLESLATYPGQVIPVIVEAANN